MSQSTQLIANQSNKELVARQAGRTAISKGAEYMLKQGVKTAAVQGVKEVAKTAACPMLIVGDIAELGVKTISGSENAGRATSLAVYVGTGTAMGGPIGGAAAVAVWGIGQAVSALVD